MAAIIITVILSAIAGILWALCAANTDGDFEEFEEDEENEKRIKKLPVLRRGSKN